MATIHDVAKRAGVAPITVSRVVNNSGYFSQDTRARVEAAIAELEYVPNRLASSLRSKRTNTLALVITDITNPVLTQTAQAIELALSERGYGTLFATSNNTLSEEIRAIELFRSRQVDGMLIYPTSHRKLDHIRPLRRAN